LFLETQGPVFLVLQISEGTGEVEAAVHAAAVDVPSCIFDAVLLEGVMGFMITTERNAFAIKGACHCPTVACIGNVDVVLGDQHGDGCTPDSLDEAALAGVVFGNLFLSQLLQLSPALLLHEEDVHLEEGLLEGGLEVALAEVRIALELGRESLLGVEGDFGTYIVD
jgi:hypothetical protein